MRAVISTLIVVAAVSAATSAWADVTPPDVESCGSGPEGRHCTVDGNSGQCRAATCARLDYSNWDGGVPGTVTYDCFKCVEDSNSGCGSVAGRSGAEFGALAVAGSFSLLFLVRRRRGRS